MPLVTEIIRDKKPLDIMWDYNVLSCMYTAAVKDAAPDIRVNDKLTFGEVPEGRFIDFSMVPIYYLTWDIPLVKKGSQKLKRDYNFPGIVELKRGDVLRAWRE